MILFWVAVLAVSICSTCCSTASISASACCSAAAQRGEARRMLSAVAPIWDGNETWLVVTGVVLWGAFPVVYATLLSAFYLPLLVMLAGLILRGVAFEFRTKTERCGGSGMRASPADPSLPPSSRASRRALWSRVCRSPTAAMSAAISAGSAPSRSFAASAFALAMRCSAQLACAQMRRRCPRRCLPSDSLSLGGAARLPDRGVRLRACREPPGHARWLERPYLLVFPAIGALAATMLAAGIRRRRDGAPFRMVAIIFLAAFGTLAISFWPYMIPVRRSRSTRPRATFQPRLHVLGRGLFVFPLMLLYTRVSYSVFGGKVRPSETHYEPRHQP